MLSFGAARARMAGQSARSYPTFW